MFIRIQGYSLRIFIITIVACIIWGFLVPQKALLAQPFFIEVEGVEEEL